MDLNWNSRIIMCQYAEPYLYFTSVCELFHMSLTNRGIGYTFNQADFWDLHTSTWYTKQFAKIYRPKGFQKYDSEKIINSKDGSKNNIFYPVQSGPENGLTVN